MKNALIFIFAKKVEYKETDTWYEYFNNFKQKMLSTKDKLSNIIKIK